MTPSGEAWVYASIPVETVAASPSENRDYRVLYFTRYLLTLRWWRTSGSQVVVQDSRPSCSSPISHLWVSAAMLAVTCSSAQVSSQAWKRLCRPVWTRWWDWKRGRQGNSAAGPGASRRAQKRAQMNATDSVDGESVSSAHLVGPRQCCMPVHVVLWLADINHLVGVELEHTLDLQLAVVFQWLVRGDPGHLLLLQLLPSSLALPYPPQVPEGPKQTDSDQQPRPSKSPHHCTHQSVLQFTGKGHTIFFTKRANAFIFITWQLQSSKVHVVKAKLEQWLSQIWEDCPFKQLFLNPCTANSPVSELDRESNHSWIMRIYKSSRGSSGNISVQCISVAQPHSIIYEYLCFHWKTKPDFVQLKEICNYHPTWMKVLNVYLPQRVQVSGDWNHEAYFCIQGST